MKWFLFLAQRRLVDIQEENNQLREDNSYLSQRLRNDGGLLPEDNRQTTEHTKDAAEHELTSLIAELVHTKCLLAMALSKVEEEKLHRFKIMRAVDSLLDQEPQLNVF